MPYRSAPVGFLIAGSAQSYHTFGGYTRCDSSPQFRVLRPSYLFARIDSRVIPKRRIERRTFWSFFFFRASFGSVHRLTTKQAVRPNCGGNRRSGSPVIPVFSPGDTANVLFFRLFVSDGLLFSPPIGPHQRRREKKRQTKS